MATEINQNFENREPQLNLLLPKDTIDVPLWKSLFASIDAALFPKKLPPLVLTSKPVAGGELWGEHLTRPWWRSVFENMRDAFFPKKLPPLQLTSRPVLEENALDDQLSRSLLSSLAANIRDTLFPQKLPPLELTSKPVAVREIWGFYSHKKDGALASTGVHILLVALLIGGAFIARRQPAVDDQVAAQESDRGSLTVHKRVTLPGGQIQRLDRLELQAGILARAGVAVDPDHLEPPRGVQRLPVVRPIDLDHGEHGHAGRDSGQGDRDRR